MNNENMLPDLAFSLPKDCTTKLSAIISRHKQFMTAKAKGQLATRKKDLASFTKDSCILLTKGDECSLCLEQMNVGERVVKLPCGHTFHSGSIKRKRKRSERETECKGILYWLSNNSSCPQCRFDLPTELEAPDESEMLLLPLLHRQNRLIRRQMEIIKSQKRQLERLANQKTVDNPAKKARNDPKTFKFPQMSWQNSECAVQKETRRSMLGKITNVTLQDIVVRGASNLDSKTERLQELATKIEFILYCCSSSFLEYSDAATLRERTLNTVKNLADRARAMKGSVDL